MFKVLPTFFYCSYRPSSLVLSMQTLLQLSNDLLSLCFGVLSEFSLMRIAKLKENFENWPYVGSLSSATLQARFVQSFSVILVLFFNFCANFSQCHQDGYI